MIDCIFTLDYEIYGNGTGALDALVYEPGRQLADLFRAHGVRFVNFVEVLELEQIDAQGTDAAIDAVKRQVREMHQNGFEIGLHLHPQWCNARYDGGRWALDASEYNLCTLSWQRVDEIVRRAIAYMRHLVDDGSYTPLSFRAGNWLFQPTRTAADVLAAHGLRLDSSVFKGGVQRLHNLDYRLASGNGDYWSFDADVVRPDSGGRWIEVPIYTKMVPFWAMATAKRMAFASTGGGLRPTLAQKLTRTADYVRLLYPLKLDFCRMTVAELKTVIDDLIRRDRRDPHGYLPVVSIGHTKDLTDLGPVRWFLDYLRANRIAVSTFVDAYPKLKSCLRGAARSEDIRPVELVRSVTH